MRSIYYLFLIAAITLSCSKDDDAKPNYFKDVPSGEIVAVELRNETLTGSETISNEGRVQLTEKWWKQIKSIGDYQGCGEDYEDLDMSQSNTYYSFNPNGNYYVKVGTSGSVQNVATWEWASSKKDAIIIGTSSDVKFEIRSLNDNEVIIASVQPLGGGCTGVTWEQFGAPLEN